MSKIPFVKMHGLGNDFIIISENALPQTINMQKFVTLIANPHYGVGFDQLIIYNYNDQTIQMKVYNKDSSIALMCGNAARCLSRLVFDLFHVKKTKLQVSNREIECEYFSKDKIKINMGLVSFTEDWMPNSTELWNLAERYSISQKELSCVDVANPHLVIFTKLSDQDCKIIGESFQTINLFKDGININFASIIDDKIKLKVWERGTGFTYACGSGAVATFAAANKLGFTNNNAEIIFDLGSLKMDRNEKGEIIMCGPARYVFSGEFFYD